MNFVYSHSRQLLPELLFELHLSQVVVVKLVDHEDSVKWILV